MIKTNINALLNNLEQLTADYKNAEDKEEFYYKIREQFNKNIWNINKFSNFVELSAEFIFINKTCFRGLYRVNKSGKFNVPYGNYKNPNIYDKIELLKLNKLFQNVEFKSGDYKNILKDVSENDFIYLDPPYKNTFDSYSTNPFDSEDFAEFVNCLNCKCLLSNSEDFTELLNENFKIEVVEVQNKINSKSPGSSRNEILAWNY